jgi:cyclophilin family peptidyl-prolyl cis-trans isomerase
MQRYVARTRTAAVKISVLQTRATAALENVAKRALVAGALLSLVACPPDAKALLASPRRDLPRTPEAALRRSIPVFNEHIASLQGELESVQYLLRIPQRKPWQNMAESVATAVELANYDDKCLRGVLSENVDIGSELLDGIKTDLKRLVKAIEAKDPDRTSVRVSNALERLGQLELLQSPGLKYQIPSRYESLPRLTGRAVLKMTVIPRLGGERKYVELTLDGFSAPLTSGRILSNVLENKYNGSAIRVDDTSIFMDFKTPQAVSGPLPLEILAKGDFEPTYRFPLDVNSAEEIPVLPLSIDGALAVTRLGDGLSSSSEFFIFKYNRQQAGLSGLSFDEGQFSVFGYVTENQDEIRQLTDGDKVERISVLRGAELLKPN